MHLFNPLGVRTYRESRAVLSCQWLSENIPDYSSFCFSKVPRARVA